MLSLRNFYVNYITFWSSQGNLSSKKSKKTEEKGKEQKRVTIWLNRDTIPQAECNVLELRKTCHDG